MAQVTVRATNRTYGLRPAQEAGPVETAISFSSWNGAVETAEGNFYSNGGYTVVSGDVHSLPDSRYLGCGTAPAGSIEADSSYGPLS